MSNPPPPLQHTCFLGISTDPPSPPLHLCLRSEFPHHLLFLQLLCILLSSPSICTGSRPPTSPLVVVPFATQHGVNIWFVAPLLRHTCLCCHRQKEKGCRIPDPALPVLQVARSRPPPSKHPPPQPSWALVPTEKATGQHPVFSLILCNEVRKWAISWPDHRARQRGTQASQSPWQVLCQAG